MVNRASATRIGGHPIPDQRARYLGHHCAARRRAKDAARGWPNHIRTLTEARQRWLAGRRPLRGCLVTRLAAVLILVAPIMLLASPASAESQCGATSTMYSAHADCI